MLVLLTDKVFIYNEKNNLRRLILGTELFQHSTIGALMAGMFEGTLPLAEVLTQGTMGIGTLHGLDGELVIINRIPYQVKVDGSINKVGTEEKTPYVAITDFHREDVLEIDYHHSAEGLKDKLVQHFSSANTFQAVKVTGEFQKMHCRSVAKQAIPYPRLAEVAKDQAEFTRERVAGTLVGFYTPEIFGSVAVPGFHWHFLSTEKDFGGHVFDFEFIKGQVEWQAMETLTQHFPIKNKSFMKETIDYDNLAAEIEEAE